MRPQAKRRPGADCTQPLNRAGLPRFAATRDAPATALSRARSAGGGRPAFAGLHHGEGQVDARAPRVGVVLGHVDAPGGTCGLRQGCCSGCAGGSPGAAATVATIGDLRPDRSPMGETSAGPKRESDAPVRPLIACRYRAFRLRPGPALPALRGWNCAPRRTPRPSPSARSPERWSETTCGTPGPGRGGSVLAGDGGWRCAPHRPRTPTRGRFGNPAKGRGRGRQCAIITCRTAV